MTCFGPRIDNEGVCFRIWAPSADAIAVEVQGHGLTAMTTLPDGWKEAQIPCTEGARYRFRLGETAFPDPASRAQIGGVQGWSIVRRPFQRDHDWRGRPWRETILYECHPGLMGGFTGISAQLPALAELGITAIELMPVAAFPGAHNWGYDGVLSFAPAEAYGSPDDLKNLIERAHALGLMIFLDVVYNHFGPDGNYLALYAKPFFRTDTPTPWGAAIDFRRPQVCEFFRENARFWLFEFGFDGLRFDAVHTIADDGWLDRLAVELRQEAGDRQIHLILENERNQSSRLGPGKFDAQWNDDFHHALHVLLTGESNGYYQDYADNPAAQLARALAEGFVFQGERFAAWKGAPRGEPSGDLPPTAFVAFLQNHDQTGNRPFGERLTRLADPDALKAAIALLLLMPQIPMIFMGEEIGSRAPFFYFTDHGPKLAKAVREGRRREFASYAGVAPDHPVPDPNMPETFDASDPSKDAPDAQHWRDFYRGLLRLRQRRIIPVLDGTRSEGAEMIGKAAVFARWRLGDGSRLAIASNLGRESVQLPDRGQTLIWGEQASEALAARTSLAWLDHA